MATNPNEQPAPAKSNKTLWLVITVLLLIMVTGVAVGGTYFYMSNGDSSAQADAKPAKQEPPPKPVFVAVDPFTVNLQDDRGRILYVRIALKVNHDADATRLTENMPQVRNRILLTLSNADAKTLTTVDGKQALASALQKKVSEPFLADADPVGVSDVLFTDFIVQ